MDEVRLLDVLDEAVRAVRSALDVLDDWGPAGTRPGQYRLDLAADGAALPVLHGAGLAVLSEESGVTGDATSGLLAVIDPMDGSTNAHRGVPFYSTSICVLDAEGPLVGLVVNQATGARYAAVRGGGAEADGGAIRAVGVRGAGERHRRASRGSRATTRVGPSTGRWAQRRSSAARSPRACSTRTWWSGAARSTGGTIWPGCSSAARPVRPRGSATAGPGGARRVEPAAHRGGHDGTAGEAGGRGDAVTR